MEKLKLSDIISKEEINAIMREEITRIGTEKGVNNSEIEELLRELGL